MAEQDDLEPFIIDEVHGFPESGDVVKPEGQGAYGVVYKVTVGGVPCIAKRVHDILVSQRRVSKEDREHVLKKFRNECVVLSKLRHPNIVHFVGVHYHRCADGQSGLSLIMESLQCDLGEFVETKPNIPLPVKLSMLLDVSYGLLYLHDQTPQIIHRDLSVQNVLVAINGRAKIADLGVAKLLDPKTQAAIAHTRNPGNFCYMPPEAQYEHAHCSAKLDIFSFGHLSIYAVNQEAPNVHEVPITVEIQRERSYQTAKRRKDIERMGTNHCLYDVVMRCLQDDPDERPSTLELNLTLKHLSTKYPMLIKHVSQIWKDSATGVSKVGNDSLMLELEDARKTIEDQKNLLISVTAEKNDTKSQLDLVQQQVVIYKADFEEERKDREQAHSKLADLEMKEKEFVKKIAIHQEEIKKLKGRRRWRSGSKDKAATSLQAEMDEMADKIRRDEIEKQYAAEKEMLVNQKEELLDEVKSLKSLNQQLKDEARLSQQASGDSIELSPSLSLKSISELDSLLQESHRKIAELHEENTKLRLQLGDARQ